MTYWTDAQYDFSPSDRGSFSRQAYPHTISGAVALTLGMLVGGWILYLHSTATLFAPPDAILTLDEAPTPAATDAQNVYGALPAAQVIMASPKAYGALAVAPQAAPSINQASTGTPGALLNSDTYIALLDPTYSLGLSPASLEQSSPLASDFRPNPLAPPATIAANVRPVPTPPVSEQLVQNVPLPAPRPTGLQVAASHGPLRAFGRQVAENSTIVLPTPADHRSIIAKLFGMEPQPNGPTLAYAAPEDGVGDERTSVAAPVGADDRSTAVYDISAHTVYLPNGTRLEAHSGLGEMLDNPRYVAERMRGPTPPGTYDLQPREQLFHGIQALRLIPVGNTDLYGRGGLLAHTYMLGQNGDSFGCVSFRDYNAFLRAYESGEIKRLTVVARMN
jgi:hypothetical protein